jgi:2-keto-4-pentenoate hydratase/2-oxohepta-3-ene-1,7-dioic acid hydratase in catechol pathway
LRRLLEKAEADKRGRKLILHESRVKFGPVVPHPQKIICVGFNYRQHAQEMHIPIPAVPLLFNKYSNALLGHRGRIKLPTKVSSQFDYEVELVVVIGRKARDVPEEKALSYVFGYANGNDISARDLQRATSQLMLGKTCDGFAPLGPWLVSADQVPDPQRLQVATYVNGERRQHSNTLDMIFSCAQIVSYCSRHMTLLPGDVIYTGTPQGVIQGYPEDKRAWLKAGDKVVTEVEKCGTLEVTLA